MTTNAFHIQAQVCYNTVCEEVPVRWVRDFDGTESNAYSLIMLVFPVGPAEPGIWVKDMEGRWRLVIPYAEASELFSTKETLLKVLVGNENTESFNAATTSVFRNGALVTPPETEPSNFDVWGIATLSETNAEGVTKDDDAASAGILQVSGGADKTIKDFLPGTEGVVSVDEDGVASVTELIPLMSGGGLLIGNILKA
jgi:hypothetical protein